MNSLKPDDFAQSLFAETHRLESCEPSVYVPLLQAALQVSQPRNSSAKDSCKNGIDWSDLQAIVFIPAAILFTAFAIIVL